MRIAICGPHKDEVFPRVESVLNTQVKLPWKADIIDQAADTYKYFNENNVVFSGSAFDYLALEPAEGYDDVYEQIALNSLENLNYIAVITMDMDRKQLKIYEEYQKLFPDKIYLYSSPIDFEVRLK